MASFFADTDVAITLCEWDPVAGRLSKISEIREGTVNPFTFAIDGSQRFLYSADSLAGTASVENGAIAVHAVDPGTGELSYIGSQPSGGKIPVDVTLSSDGRFAFAVNCGLWGGATERGSLHVYPVDANGRLGACSAERFHAGSSLVAPRQTASHPHAVVLDPEDRWVFVPDLGTDRIEIYEFDSQSGTLSDEPIAGLTVAPGSGPRTLRFHPNGRHAYLINEIGNTIVAFDYSYDYNYDVDDYDYGKGAPSLSQIQSVSTLPAGCEEQSDCADLQIHPAGRFLYGSNRGHDSIAIFEIDARSGKLTTVDVVASGGIMPSSMSIDPTGGCLLVTNQRSNRVATFRISLDTGRLTALPDEFEVASPAWVSFVSRAG